MKRGELHCASSLPLHLATSDPLFLQLHKRYNYPTTPLPCLRIYQPSPSFSQFSPQPSTVSFFLSSHGPFQLLLVPGRSCNLNIRLEAGICGGKLLSGGRESEAEWMKGSLATLARGKLLKRSCRAREIFQQQKDELQ